MTLVCVNNPNLYCIDVDNVSLANLMWSSSNNSIDPWTSFSTNCATALGCTDILAFNYNPIATIDDGSCIAVVLGCLDSTAFNYAPLANTSNNTCCYIDGCTNPLAFNYNINACYDNGSCIAVVLGCLDSTAFNYAPLANTDDGSCIAIVLGCIDPIATTNYNALANTDDGSCVYLGCTNSLACNYFLLASIDDGSCNYDVVVNNTHDICNGQSFTVGTNSYTNPGTYIDVLTASNGCDSTIISIINVSYLSLTASSTPVTCSSWNDGSVAVSASGGFTPYTFNWSTGDTTAQVANLQMGNYTITVSDGVCSVNGSTNII